MTHQAPQVWRKHKEIKKQLNLKGQVLHSTGKLALIELENGERKMLATNTPLVEGTKVKLVMRKHSSNEQGLILYTIKAIAVHD